MPKLKDRTRPVVLCILDGWGERADADDNAITRANIPFWNHLVQTSPHAVLATSGLSVGLPDGQMGNSEVGHMTIGSGRVLMQSLPRIDMAIADGSLAQSPAMTKLITALKKNHKACHILGLVSPGGVHSHQNHIAALANIMAKQGIPVRIHAFLDGRDTPPSSALEYLANLENMIESGADISIATVGGRYYAMDRDQRWERVQKAYHAMVDGEAKRVVSAQDAVRDSYDAGKTDEFIEPVVIGDYHGMDDGDGLIMANFRSDRARQVLTALLDPEFKGFVRAKKPKFSHTVGMVEYSQELNTLLDTVFPSEELKQILGEVVAKQGLKQLRIAETEKYAHVTFFFNGGIEEKYEGEERILVPSPKVATYDMQPEMSAPEVTKKLVKALESNTFDLLVVNYANTDMVGHTGDQGAAIKAVEAVDRCLQELVTAVTKAGGKIIITADHGNAEQMYDAESHGPHTAHTTGPVPVILAGAGVEGVALKSGKLSDVAPTVLALMGIKKPVQMTGESLIV